MTRDEHVALELERRFREWAVLAAPLGAAVFLILAPLDIVTAPELAGTFFRYRLFAAGALLLIGWLSSRSRGPAALRVWVFTGVLLSAASIELMILRLEGARSPYSTGMILLAVFAIGLIPASPALHALYAGTVFAVYLLPLLMAGRVSDTRAFFTQAYLFLAVLATMIAIRFLHRRTAIRELGFAYELAKHERQLEAEVAQRTNALTRAAAEWRSTFDSTRDLIIMVDAEGGIVRANMATAVLAGTPPDWLVGSSVFGMFPATDIPRGPHPLEELRRTGARTEAEFHRRGAGRWFLMSAEPLRGEGALAGGAVLIVRDVTDVKLMEQKLVAARDDWEETFDSIQEGITIHDRDFVVVRANAAARRLLCQPDAALEGRRCFELLHHAAAPPGPCPSCAAFRSGTATRLDLFEPTLGRCLELTAIPRPGGGAIRVVHDVSERKEAIDELSRAARRLQRILEQSPFGIFVVDEAFRIEFANPAVLTITGYPWEEFVGAFFGSIAGWNGFDLFDRVQHALEGVPFRIGPFEYFGRDPGRRVVGQFTGIPLEEQGRRKALVFVEDLTHLKRGEEERQRLGTLLMQAQKMESVGTLASGIAHDFNNILLAVMGLSDAALERLPADHPVREELEAVIGAAERGSILVRQILAFSRQQELRMRSVNLRELAEETRRMLVPVLPKTLTLSVGGTGPAPVAVADPVQIEQVLVNLAVNARDAMPEGGTIAIETSLVDVTPEDPRHPGVPPGLHALIAVRDTGSGIPPEVRERIFDPFFTTKEPGHGTGLGLATVYGIVAQHGGHLRVESEPGHGTTFFVYLPAADRPEAC